MDQENRAIPVSSSQGEASSRRVLTRGDLAAILGLIFVVMLAVAEKYRGRIEGLFGSMGSSTVSQEIGTNELEAALEEALLTPPPVLSLIHI